MKISKNTEFIQSKFVKQYRTKTMNRKASVNVFANRQFRLKSSQGGM